MLKNPSEQLVFIHPLIAEVLGDKCLSSHTVDKLQELISTAKINTRAEYVLHETAIAILHINESLSNRHHEIISIGSLGTSSKITVQQEKKILQDFLEIIEGERAYRLSVCINKQGLCYTNMIPL